MPQSKCSFALMESGASGFKDRAPDAAAAARLLLMISPPRMAAMTTPSGTKSLFHGTETESWYTTVIQTYKLSGRKPIDNTVETVVIATERARSALKSEHPCRELDQVGFDNWKVSEIA